MVEHVRVHESAVAEGAEGRRFVLPVLLGLGLAAMSFLLEEEIARLVALSAGSALVAVVLTLALRDRLRALARGRLVALLRRLTEHDGQAILVVGQGGRVLHQNPVALDRFGDCTNLSLGRALTDFFASPSTAFLRMQTLAEDDGFAHETVSLKRGRVRISAQAAGEGLFLWRFDLLPGEDAPRPRQRAVALPHMVVGPQGGIVAQNDAMRAFTGWRPLTIDALVADPPLTPGTVHRLHTPGGDRNALLLEPETFEDRRELYWIDADVLPAAAPAQDLETLPIPLMELSESGHLLRANAQARDLLHVDVARGQALQTLVEGLGRPIDQWLKEAAASPKGSRSEVLRLAHPEAEIYLQITLMRRTLGPGAMFVGILQDATELKTLEAQFVQSQKMQAIGQLAGGVAHDFNNLLTAISGHCDLLLLRHDPGDPDYPDLEQINQNANRAASLVSQLLAYSRKQTLRPELIDLRDALSDLSHLLNRLVGERIRLELRHDPNQRRIRADRRQLEQVIMNLVVNARDAMPSGGRILVETRETHLAGPLQRDRAEVPPGDYVVIAVTDEGVGIPPDRLPKIFEPFYTTKRQGEGTGLGLSTVYGIVKQSGGFVFAESETGVGTVFTLYFPAMTGAGVERAPAPAPLPDPMPRRRDGVILLVEDEAPVRAFAARALRLRGLTVLEADSAETALAMLKDLDKPVDVFVTDVIMPGRDGPTWVQEALETRPNTRVVFMSGYAEESFAEAQKAIPNSVFLPKPFTLSKLTSVVQDQLG